MAEVSLRGQSSNPDKKEGMMSQRMMYEDTSIRLSFRSFRWFQYCIVVFLTFLGLVYYIYDEYESSGPIHDILELFDPGSETSITTSFAVLNLLISSVLIFVIYRHARSQNDSMAFHWLALSIIFFGLSIDEGAEIHERAGHRFFHFVDVGLPVIETHSWLLAGVLFTALVGLFFIPFLLKLDMRTRFLFMLSGTIFLAGAIVIEFTEALAIFEGSYQLEDLTLRIRRVAEEGCELLGIAIFNCTPARLDPAKGDCAQAGKHGLIEGGDDRNRQRRHPASAARHRPGLSSRRSEPRRAARPNEAAPILERRKDDHEQAMALCRCEKTAIALAMGLLLARHPAPRCGLVRSRDGSRPCALMQG